MNNAIYQSKSQKADRFRAEIIKLNGVEYKSTSITSFGVSVYGDYKGNVVRISDHSTGATRFMSEIHLSDNSTTSIEDQFDMAVNPNNWKRVEVKTVVEKIAKLWSKEAKAFVNMIVPSVTVAVNFERI